MKILYFDTETTGINPEIHEITQFAAIVEVDGVIVEEVNFRCQPTNWEAIDPQALLVTGVNVEQLKTFDKPAVMLANIIKLFNKHIDKFDSQDKFYPAGHNVSFDIEFLQRFFKRHGDRYGTGSYQNWRLLDSRIFANFLIACGKLKTFDVKLESLCRHYGIELDAHDALNDIRATRTLIHKMFSEITK